MSYQWYRYSSTGVNHYPTRNAQLPCSMDPLNLILCTVFETRRSTVAVFIVIWKSIHCINREGQAYLSWWSSVLLYVKNHWLVFGTRHWRCVIISLLRHERNYRESSFPCSLHWGLQFMNLTSFYLVKVNYFLLHLAEVNYCVIWIHCFHFQARPSRR